MSKRELDSFYASVADVSISNVCALLGETIRLSQKLIGISC